MLLKTARASVQSSSERNIAMRFASDGFVAVSTTFNGMTKATLTSGVEFRIGFLLAPVL